MIARFDLARVRGVVLGLREETGTRGRYMRIQFV